MKTVTYSDNIEEQDKKALEETTKLLEEVMGASSAALANAEWKLTKDGKGHPVFTLRISDWTGEASTTFAPYELPNSSNTRYRLIRLWGDLLQVRSHKQLEKLTADASTAGE